VLKYEIPNYDGDLGNSNLFVPLPAATYERKIELLLEQLPRQRDRRWFTPHTFWALLRLRDVECNAPSGFAEAFHTGRQPWDYRLQTLSRRPCVRRPST
jgi:hypothetical protein